MQQSIVKSYALVADAAAGSDIAAAHAASLAHGAAIRYGQSWQENGEMQPFYMGPIDAVRAHGVIPLNQLGLVR